MNLSNFKKSIAVFALVLFAGIMLGTGNTTVDAATLYSVTSLKQTAADKTSVTVSFQAAEGATSYNVYYKEYGTDDYISAGNTTDTTYTITGLKSGVNYVVKICSTNGIEESYGSTNYNIVTLPDKLTGLHQKYWWYFFIICFIHMQA